MSLIDRLAGVFAPVVTPFEGGALRLDYLGENLDALGGSSLAGYMALGSNGEFRSLGEDEQDEVLRVFADRAGEKLVMVGTSGESAREVIRRTNRVASMGFECAVVLSPGYFAKHMSDEALRGFYIAVADETRIPLVLYNAPQFTGGVELKPKLVADLAKHPNIVGLKDSGKSGPFSLLAQLGSKAEFAVLAGSTGFFYPSLHVGARGGVLSPANVVPDACVELYEKFVAGDYPSALDLHERLSRLNQAVSGAYGVAGVKAAVTAAGMRGGEPRLPLLPVAPERVAGIAQALRAAGFE